MLDGLKTEFSEITTKMVLDKNRQLIPLLAYIKEHENDGDGISREKVVKYMFAEGHSSRITTLRNIDALLQVAILIDPKTKNYQSNLKINPRFDLYRLVFDSIYYQLQDMQEALKPFESLINSKKFKLDFKIGKDKDKDKFEVTLTPTPT
jgi:hypothetical protein